MPTPRRWRRGPGPLAEVAPQPARSWQIGHPSFSSEAVAAEGGLCNRHMWYLSRLATDLLVTRLVRATVRAVLDGTHLGKASALCDQSALLAHWRRAARSLGDPESRSRTSAVSAAIRCDPLRLLRLRGRLFTSPAA